MEQPRGRPAALLDPPMPAKPHVDAASGHRGGDPAEVGPGGSHNAANTPGVAHLVADADFAFVGGRDGALRVLPLCSVLRLTPHALIGSGGLD